MDAFVPLKRIRPVPVKQTEEDEYIIKQTIPIPLELYELCSNKMNEIENYLRSLNYNISLTERYINDITEFSKEISKYRNKTSFQFDRFKLLLLALI